MISAPIFFMKKIIVNKLSTLTGHKDCVYTLEKSSENDIFYSGAGDGMVVAWDMKDPGTGKLVAKVPSSVYAIHYYQPADTLVIGQNFAGIHWIDPVEKKEKGSLKISEAAFFDIQSYEDKLIIASGDGVITMVDFYKKSIVKQIEASAKSARTIAINHQQGEFAVGFSDNYIRIYDANTFALKHEFEAHKKSVFTLKYFPDNNLLISGSRDAHLKFWDAKNNYEMKESIVAHMYAINNVYFSPQGDHFVSCSMDKSIKVWDTKQLKLLKVIDKARHAGHGTSVNKLFWSEYYNRLVSCSDDRTISIWDLNFNNHENNTTRN